VKVTLHVAFKANLFAFNVRLYIFAKIVPGGLGYILLSNVKKLLLSIYQLQNGVIKDSSLKKI
jgi:hypothetical protein